MGIPLGDIDKVELFAFENRKDNCKGSWKAISDNKLCIFKNFHIHK